MEENSYSCLNDKELWSKLINGDEDALAFIYNTHFPSLYKYGMKIFTESGVVKDCIHDLFAALWFSRERLSGTDSIKYYLFASLKRRIVRHSRPGLLHRLLETAVSAPSVEQTIIEEQSSQERSKKLEKVIKKLPKRQKEILYLRYYEGLTTQETADIMSLSIDSTYVLLSKALNYLRKHSDELVAIMAYIYGSNKF
ncbi:RNA polymerase sigma factor [Chitinophaga oryziterrae]|uniref:RNA polymerase sigma factor n=1 Tax=Chitinophaga oryziterrae TaxID=1031224 RepID=UPI0012FA40B1|nr:sigma-70 family RNA polymerase sigma factor [Chitinophaga oryziterrae]